MVEAQRNELARKPRRIKLMSLIRCGSSLLVVLPDDHAKFILALKHTTPGEITHKTRFVLGDHPSWDPRIG